MVGNILTINDLNLIFVSTQNKDESLYLFKDLKLEIPRGKITALVGGNGAGKTTLFNVISGLQKGSKGRIIFEGRNIESMRPHSIARLGVGRLFQGARIFDELSILDNLRIGGMNPSNEKPFFNLIFPKKNYLIEDELTEKARQVLSGLFGEGNQFWQKRNEPAGILSFGQQRLLAISRLLMGDYSLYLLDEPTAGVNVHFIEHIASAIRHLNSYSQKTVVLIEHNMQFVRQLADYCLFMSEGKIIANGTPDEVLDNEKVRKNYMGF